VQGSNRWQLVIKKVLGSWLVLETSAYYLDSVTTEDVTPGVPSPSLTILAEGSCTSQDIERIGAQTEKYKRFTVSLIAENWPR
jgi:hypothetical protein